MASSWNASSSHSSDKFEWKTFFSKLSFLSFFHSPSTTMNDFFLFVCPWANVTNQILNHIATLCCHIHPWLVKNSHLTWNIQWECFVIALHSYAMLNFDEDIGYGFLLQLFSSLYLLFFCTSYHIILLFMPYYILSLLHTYLLSFSLSLSLSLFLSLSVFIPLKTI